MARLLWGQVYYHDQFVGYLRQEPGSRVSFCYDESYLNSGAPAIAYTLPLQKNSFIYTADLPPFFDNLVAEGWLEQAQKKLLEKRAASRFELLLAYGHDCSGAVSVVDPEPAEITEKLLDHSNPQEMALLTNRASLSGVQPKMTVIARDGKFFPSKFNELSTHIAKFSSKEHDDLLENEYLSMQAFQALLPNDSVAELFFGEVENVAKSALLIKRFDRNNGQRIHFEEFNQLLGRASQKKYDGAYEDMSVFISNNTQCLITENYRLFLRILAGMLIGNTDMHLKNFSMIYTPHGLRLAPSYDQVSAVLYGYKTLALSVAGAANFAIDVLKPRSIIRLGRAYGLSDMAIDMAVKQLAKNLPQAIHAVTAADIMNSEFKEALVNLMRKKWNGIFALIGKHLSKKR
ncbi:MAG: HipA domain-containing protein [Gammaproteobacteria bacterium]|nr:HipA domain-containing protein [Gammaproteobacteria bacterium]